jgi:hypothetical protein
MAVWMKNVEELMADLVRRANAGKARGFLCGVAPRMALCAVEKRYSTLAMT